MGKGQAGEGKKARYKQPAIPIPYSVSSFRGAENGSIDNLATG